MKTVKCPNDHSILYFKKVGKYVHCNDCNKTYPRSDMEYEGKDQYSEIFEDTLGSLLPKGV